MKKTSALFLTLASFGILFTMTGCHNMEDQPKIEAYERSELFPDKMGSRMPVEDTVARGKLKSDEHLYTGKVNGRFATSFPFPVTKQVLERGRDRFNIYCSVCHNQTGTGDGMIVRRGFKQPPAYDEERLRLIPVGYLFDVITNGFANMASYSAELSAEDRWAVIAYIRALQKSRNVPLSKLREDEIKKLTEASQETESLASVIPAAEPGSQPGESK